MTCVTSAVDEDQGTNPSSKGSSEGPLFREGAWFEMYNSVVTSNEATMLSNECIELDDSEGPETIDGAQDGTSVAASNVIACDEATKEGPWSPDNDGFDLAAWLAAAPNTNNVVVGNGGNLPFTSLIVGGVGTRGYLTEAAIQDSTGAAVFDQATQLFDVGAIGGIFETPTYLGGANAGDDWLAGWAVGLSDPLNP